jgi:hypothetical protein
MLTAGDGGLFSTLDNLFLWDQALNTERFVKDALKQAFTPGTTNVGLPANDGFGWYTNVFPHLSAAGRERLLALGAGLRQAGHKAAISHTTTTLSAFSIPSARSTS